MRKKHQRYESVKSPNRFDCIVFWMSCLHDNNMKESYGYLPNEMINVTVNSKMDCHKITNFFSYEKLREGAVHSLIIERTRLHIKIFHPSVR